MKTIGRFEFPENPEEARSWERHVEWVARHWQVLFVAATRIEGAWKVYVAPVPGVNHEYEWRRVLSDGVQIEEKLARVLFPHFADIPYAE